MIKWAITALALALAPSVAAQPPGGDQKAVPFVTIDDEPPAGLWVDQPVPAALARGAVIIPYHTKNFRILPVFGSSALDVSPRAGHLHVSVDGLPWRWADAGDNGAVVVNGLPAGPHKILIELATPIHGVLTGKEVQFVVPAVPSIATVPGKAH